MSALDHQSGLPLGGAEKILPTMNLLRYPMTSTCVLSPKLMECLLVVVYISTFASGFHIDCKNDQSLFGSFILNLGPLDI